MRLTAMFKELRSARTWATVRRGMFAGILDAISEAIAIVIGLVEDARSIIMADLSKE